MASWMNVFPCCKRLTLCSWKYLFHCSVWAHYNLPISHIMSQMVHLISSRTSFCETLSNVNCYISNLTRVFAEEGSLLREDWVRRHALGQGQGVTLLTDRQTRTRSTADCSNSKVDEKHCIESLEYFFFFMNSISIKIDFM